MNIRYKEDPGAWRKSTLLTLLPLAILCAVLLWRRVLMAGPGCAVLLILGCVALLAVFYPRLFRSYYRFSTWAGFWSSQAVARVFLVVIFTLFITPAGIILRALGKDSLQLKRSSHAASYWKSAKPTGSLDRSF